MNTFRMLVVACGMVLAGAMSAPAQEKAQDKPREEAGSYRFVSGDEVLTHGDSVTLVRKGGEKVSGTFVWADPKSGRMFVRPKAGVAPVAVMAKDVDKIERITPAIGQLEKGGVRPAIETEGKPLPKYEIHSMSVRNGPYTSTFFYDLSLSSAERDQLRAMEKAANEVARQGTLIESLNQAIQDSARTDNVNVVQTAYPGYGAYAGVPYPYLYPYYYPVNYYVTYYAMYPAYAFGYYPFGGSTVVMQNSGTGTETQAKLTKSLSEAQAALAAAQKDLAMATNRAIYDPAGRVVAVRLEE
jgi:hypothetical protein